MRRLVKQYNSWDEVTKKNDRDLDQQINEYADEKQLEIVQITFSRCVQALVLFRKTN